MLNKTTYLLLIFLLFPFVVFAEKKQKNVVPTIAKVTLSDEDRLKFDYFFHDAVNSKVLTDYGSAYDYLSYCLHKDSTNATVLFEFGNLYNSLDEKSKALSFFKKAAENDRKNFYYNSTLGALYLELQQYTEAIPLYEKLVAENPDKPDLYLYLSESYRLNGDYPNAIKALDDVEKLVGLNEKISMQKFQLYSALDNRNKAYEEFKKYIEKYPQEIRYYIFLGNIYVEDNKFDEAYLILSKARSIDPDNPYLIAAMANYYERTNRKEDAERELHIALLSPKLDIDTKLGILTQYVGTLQQNGEDTQRANALMDTLMIEHPQEPKLNLMYGNLLLLQKKAEEAQSQFRIFAEANPTNPVGWEQLLRSIPPDSIDASVEVCRTAISYLPDEPLFYFYLGIGEYQKEEKQTALKTLKEGVSRTSEDDSPILISEFYGMIGSLYFDLNESDSAFTAYRKALVYNPQNLGVLNNYSYHLSLEKKDLDRAEKMSSVTIKAEPTNPTYLDTYGWILFEQGDYVTAKIYLENAVKYSEEKEKEVSSEVLEHYGDALYKLGDADKALEYWQKAKAKGDSKSKTLDKKIETKTYIDPTEK
ncbi:MAG: tetratricopeptide repeat protein [Dysgonomonas sp.]